MSTLPRFHEETISLICYLFHHPPTAAGETGRTKLNVIWYLRLVASVYL